MRRRAIFSRVGSRGLGLAVVLLTLFVLGCENKRDSRLPHVDVYISISLTLPQFEPLNYPGNIILYPNAGYNNNGVYIVRVSEDSFAAFDVTCTDHWDKPTATRLEGGVARCPECKEEYYLLNYGFSLDKSKHLQQYKAELVPGTTLLVVRN